MKTLLATVVVGTGVAAAAVATVQPWRASPPPEFPASTAVQESFALADPAPEAAPIVELQAPRFDLLRVEPDGSLLVAGQARPNADIEIVADGERLGTVRTGPTGGFVYTTDSASRRAKSVNLLRLREGDRTSRQVAVVASREDGSDTLALITSPDEATRLLRNTVADDRLPVTVEAVEIEADEVFVAGRAPRAGASRVRVYLNEQFVGETEVDENEAYLLRSEHAIEPGRHEVRVDLIESGGGEVTARAKVPLLHHVPDDAELEDDPAALRTGASVIIRHGDSLWRISRRAYGKGTRYTTIFEANRAQIADPDLIYAGQVFKLPTAGRDDG